MRTKQETNWNTATVALAAVVSFLFAMSVWAVVDIVETTAETRHLAHQCERACAPYPGEWRRVWTGDDIEHRCMCNHALRAPEAP